MSFVFDSPMPVDDEPIEDVSQELEPETKTEEHEVETEVRVEMEEPPEESEDETVEVSPASVVTNDYFTQLWQAEKVCRDREEIVNTLSAQLKVAKKSFDAAVADLRELVGELGEEEQAEANDEQRPLLKVAEETSEAEQPEAEAEDSQFVDLSEIEIGKLNLTDSILGKLIEAGIETLADLEDLREKISKGKEGWPRGIGEAKANKIEDAIVEFWATIDDDDEPAGEAEAVEPEPEPEPSPPAEEELRTLSAELDSL